MAGPYDYTVNIPQPPAQNFLQSLSGIMQIRNMQDQAAIAQQQAAFQKEMQPLEMQRAQAAIAAQQSALAGSEQSRRQNEILFKQGQENRVREMEQQAVAQARQQELFGKLNSLPANASMADIVPIANQLALIKPEVSKQIMDNFSALPEEYQKASKTALITATTQLEAGNIDGAKQTYSTLEQAIKNSAGNNPQLKAMADGIKAQGIILDMNPNAGKLSALQMLGAVDAKALDSIVALEKTQAEGAISTARQKQVDEEKRTLELEKMRLQNRELEQKLQPGAAPVSDTQQKDINALTSEAGKIRTNVAGLTDSVDDLLKFAEQFPKEFKSGGQAALQNIMSSISGDTTRAQNLRASIEPYTKAQWIAKASGLKGSLSDKESAMLQKGAPKVETAGPAELLNWARLAQKVELADANQKDFDAAWQQNVRSLQLKSPVEFEVSGVVVKPGDSYGKVLTKINAQNRKKNDEEIQADAARLKRIQEAEKSGTSPIPNMYNLGGAPQQQQPAYVPPSGVIIKSRK